MLRKGKCVMSTAIQTEALPARKPTLRQRLDLGNGLFPYYLVIPTIVIIALVAAYPIIDSVRLSLLNNPLIPSRAPCARLRNYIHLIGEPPFQNSIAVTLISSVL